MARLRRLADTERMGDDLRHQVGVGDRRERGEVHASRQIAILQLVRHLERQPRSCRCRPVRSTSPAAPRRAARLASPWRHRSPVPMSEVRGDRQVGRGRHARPRRRGRRLARLHGQRLELAVQLLVDSYRSAGFFARQRLSTHCSGSGASGRTSDQRRRLVAEDGRKFLHCGSDAGRRGGRSASRRRRCRTRTGRSGSRWSCPWPAPAPCSRSSRGSTPASVVPLHSIVACVRS